MPDRIPLLVDYGHAELTGRIPGARCRQLADQAGVQRAEAVRLSGPLCQARHGEQRERQVPADGHQGAARHASTALVPAGGAGASAIPASTTWTTTPAGSALAGA